MINNLHKIKNFTFFYKIYLNYKLNENIDFQNLFYSLKFILFFKLIYKYLNFL